MLTKRLGFKGTVPDCHDKDAAGLLKACKLIPLRFSQLETA
ncbi:hypothetical protein EKH55_4830 [Sinorhizobium alkalisoli]|nr:hypothetical protein EKH55_4830 [Sinorhizobium alkalisoli]